MEESNRFELRRDTPEPIADMCLCMSDSLISEDLQTIARLIRSCRRNIISFWIKCSLNVTLAAMIRQLELLVLFGSEMEGARNNIEMLTLKCSDTGRGERPNKEDTIARSNAVIAALRPFLQSKTIIETFRLDASGADARGIRSLLGSLSRSVEFHHCPNFGYDAVRVLIELSRKANHQWCDILLVAVPVGNVEIELLLKWLNTKALKLIDIPLDDVGAEMVSMALRSASTKSLERLTISRCRSLTARGATMIEKSVYDTTSLQNVLLSNHTLDVLMIDVVDEELWRIVGRFEFCKRFDPSLVEKDILPSFVMVKVATYIKSHFISSEVAAIPHEMLYKLLATCGGLGDLDLFFRITSCSRFSEAGVGENGQELC